MHCTIPSHGSDPRLVAAAEVIGGRIRDAAVRVGRDTVVWRGSGGEPLGPHLYAGHLGLAFFLAALDHVRGSTEHRELIRCALAPLRRKLAERAATGREPRADAALGGLVGAGSLIYGLLRTGQWTQDDAMVADACAATLLVTRAGARADTRLDVVRGCAGAALALLTLDAADPAPNTRGDTPLALALACVDRLLASGAVEAAGGGFAHGAAGMSAALARAAVRTGSRPLRRAARAGFARQRAARSTASAGDRPWLAQSWCHGAAGTVLSRLELPDDEPSRADAIEAAASAAAAPSRSVDSLCCGDMGRADALISASRALGEPALLERAREVAHGVAARVGSGVRLVPFPGAGAAGLSLFAGEAGIGFTLLRTAHPGALPSPLALE